MIFDLLRNSRMGLPSHWNGMSRLLVYSIMFPSIRAIFNFSFPTGRNACTVKEISKLSAARISATIVAGQNEATFTDPRRFPRNLPRSLARVSRDCLALELGGSCGSAAHLRGLAILRHTTSHLAGPGVTAKPATGFGLSRGLAHLSRECAARNRCRYRNGSFHSDCLDRSRLLGTRSWN